MKYSINELSNEEANVVNCIIDAYIAAFGEEAWFALDGQQQHDIVMAVAKGAYNALAIA